MLYQSEHITVHEYAEFAVLFFLWSFLYIQSTPETRRQQLFPNKGVIQDHQWEL